MNDYYSWTPSRPCPPSPLLPTNHGTLPHPTTTTHTNTHPHTHTHTHNSHTPHTHTHTTLTLTLHNTHHTHTHTHHTHTHTHSHSHSHSHWDKHRSLVQHWDWPHSTTSSDSPEQKRLLLVTLNSLDKLFALHHYILHCLFVCLFSTDLHYLPCALCHFIHFLYYYF